MTYVTVHHLRQQGGRLNPFPCDDGVERTDCGRRVLQEGEVPAPWAIARANVTTDQATVTCRQCRRTWLAMPTDSPQPLIESALLPGETGGYSVYLIAFDDGATYVGITGGLVENRIDQHFGAAPHGGERPPFAAQHGLGTMRIVQRASAGVTYHVKVLASGLDRSAAFDRERIEIDKLDKPLNAAGPVRAWADPFQQAEVSAVAHYRYGAVAGPPASLRREDRSGWLR